MDLQEEWRPVAGFPDYVVSNRGRAASIKSGELRVLRGFLNDGYRCITVRDANGRHTRPVHRLVAEAFLGPRPDGLETRHLDGDSTNNDISNLLYGTRAENMQDRLAHGRHPMASKTHCKRGHEFTEDNTRVYRGARFCRACQRNRRANAALRAASVPAGRAA